MVRVREEVARGGGGVVTMDDEKPMNAVLMAAAKQVFGVRLSLCEERWWFVSVCVRARVRMCAEIHAFSP